MRCLLAGYGEIGKAIYEVFKDYHNIDIIDFNIQGCTPETNVYKNQYDILLVCFPYSDDFVDLVKGYQDKYDCGSVIIFSTVAIGTTKQIPCAVHCPIEGRHPNLTKSIRIWQFMMGGYDLNAHNFFKLAGTQVQLTELPETTEFIKMASTSYYGVMLEYIRYVNETMQSLGIDFRDFQTYIENYNRLYQGLGYYQFTRPQLYPPEGNIGGHCVVPNAEILDKQFPSVFLKEIYKDKENLE